MAIEIDDIELLPFSSITDEDLARTGENDIEALRRRAAHAGPIGHDTLLYRVEFHVARQPDDRDRKPHRGLVAVPSEAEVPIVRAAVGEVRRARMSLEAGRRRQGMDSGYADVNGLHLYYEVDGDGGTPLVLLHGGVMTIELTYASLLPTLTQRHRVIGVDFQAQRRTADIDRDLTYANLASDVVGLLDHLGIERAHVIGHSMGGGTALELAVNHPDRLLSVVPISASVRPEGAHPDLADPSTYSTSTRMPTEQDFAEMAEAYAKVAPHPERFDDLLDGDVLGAALQHAGVITGCAFRICRSGATWESTASASRPSPRAHLSLAACSEQVSELVRLGYLERRTDRPTGQADLPHSTRTAAPRPSRQRRRRDRSTTAASMPRTALRPSPPRCCSWVSAATRRCGARSAPSSLASPRSPLMHLGPVSRPVVNHLSACPRSHEPSSPGWTAFTR